MGEGLDQALARAHGRQRVVFLDYDGTLVPFADSPDRAPPDATLLTMLEQLGRRVDTSVHIVSGRPRGVLESWLGHLPVSLHAENGFWRRPHHRGAWVAPLSTDHGRWMEPVVDLMSAAERTAPGSFVEKRTASLAWHYRRADPSVAATARLRLRSNLGGICQAHSLTSMEVSEALEVRPSEIHKGRVVADVLRDSDPSAYVLAVGDDPADEDMFTALLGRGVAICAGDGVSRAPYRVPGPAAVRDVLSTLATTP